MNAHTTIQDPQLQAAEALLADFNETLDHFEEDTSLTLATLEKEIAEADKEMALAAADIEGMATEANDEIDDAVLDFLAEEGE